MVKASFIVEGQTEIELVRSDYFKKWLMQYCGIELIGNPKDGNCKGKGNMCAAKLEALAEKIRKQDAPDVIVVLADLDPDADVLCITERKKRIGSRHIDLVVIARNALEAWFLADTEAMRSWLRDGQFYEPVPESHMQPWDALKNYGKAANRGPGSKPGFARKFIRDQRFDLERAASHENCPSASYCVEKLKQLGNKGKS
ncbi:MAG: hypothetical protein QJT81_14055 [Candidatus Thiothrix putei]|uniref:DUF4276 family protein n=2 Tax=Thiothrix TaxID=1030 RepID=A0A1H4E0R9_9GAMM|nr:hypothetical protein [Thiothrix caldifontis]WGZ92946.1 MAG: hypothetical protein QJT81_14055 [Candidatus Thiothrix putei]SEA78369.1 hypothetical protein SAMN05660964_02436 [Thiothrix caldifontis]